MKPLIPMRIVRFWPIDGLERSFAHTPCISVLGSGRREKEQPSRRCSTYVLDLAGRRDSSSITGTRSRASGD
ncbi:unnamed protein product [Ectocarpus sp. 13 AM-2016]